MLDGRAILLGRNVVAALLDFVAETGCNRVPRCRRSRRTDADRIPLHAGFAVCGCGTSAGVVVAGPVAVKIPAIPLVGLALGVVGHLLAGPCLLVRGAGGSLALAGCRRQAR